jgi:hypothetical protein
MLLSEILCTVLVCVRVQELDIANKTYFLGTRNHRITICLCDCHLEENIYNTYFLAGKLTKDTQVYAIGFRYLIFKSLAKPHLVI